MDSTGRSDFSRLCAGLHTGVPLTFFAFDLVAVEGKSLVDRPLIDRKRLLEQVLCDQGQSSGVQVVEFITSNGAVLFKQMQAQGHEGIIAKRLYAPYSEGKRSPDWRKIKCIQRREFVIAGWRPDALGTGVKSLVLATFEAGRLVYRGRVGTGFTLAERRDLHGQLLEVEQSASPLVDTPASFVNMCVGCAQSTRSK